MANLIQDVARWATDASLASQLCSRLTGRTKYSYEELICYYFCFRKILQFSRIPYLAVPDSSLPGSFINCRRPSRSITRRPMGAQQYFFATIFLTTIFFNNDILQRYSIVDIS